MSVQTGGIILYFITLLLLLISVLAAIVSLWVDKSKVNGLGWATLLAVGVGALGGILASSSLSSGYILNVAGSIYLLGRLNSRKFTKSA